MAILNLSEYYVGNNSDNKTKTGDDLTLMPDRRTTAQREPLLKGLDAKYVDQKQIDNAKNQMNKTSIKNNESDNKNSLGSSLASSTGEVLDFVSTAVQLNSNVARSDKEANARTGQLALKGAGMGASIGSTFGPLGTAIGAVGGALIGGTVGALKKVPDRKKRLRAENESYNNRMFAMTNQTNQMAERALIQEELQNQQNLAKAQMGLLNLKY